MPASTTDQIVEIPLPVRGLNTDSHFGPTGYASELVNYIPSEVGRLRLRRGINDGATWRSFLNGSKASWWVDADSIGWDVLSASRSWDADKVVPIGAAVFDDAAIFTFMMQPTASHAGWVQHPYSGNAEVYLRNIYVAAYPYGNGVDVMSDTYHKDWWNPTFVPTDATKLIDAIAPCYGAGVQLNDRVFWVSPQFLDADVMTYGGGTAIPGGTAAIASAPWKIHSWAGALPILALGGGSGIAARITSVTSATPGSPNIVLAGGSTLPNLAGAGSGMLLKAAPGLAGDHSELIYRINMAPTTVNTSLTEPWGKGLADAPTIGSATNFHCEPVLSLMLGPTRPNCVNAFQGRLFTGGGTSASGLRRGGHLLQWSAAGNPDSWPSTNYSYIDQAYGDEIVALQTVGEAQLIHSRTKTFIMTGYDEDSFNIDMYHRSAGCLDPRATVVIDDRAYWLADDGVWSSNGASAPRRESGGNGVGISAAVKALLNDRDPAVSSPVLGAIGKYLVMGVNAQERNFGRLGSTHYGLGQVPNGYSFALNTETGAWFNWGLDTAASVQTDYGNYIPSLFVQFKSGPYAVMPWQGAGVKHLFDPVPTFGSVGAPSGATANYLSSFDRVFNTSGTSTDVPMIAAVTFAPLTASRGVTVRVRELEVEHHSSFSSSGNAFDLQFSSDPSAVASGPAVGTAPTTLPGSNILSDAGVVSVNRFDVKSSTQSAEARRFTVRISKSSSDTYRCIHHVLYGLYAKMEVTRGFRAQ